MQFRALREKRPGRLQIRTNLQMQCDNRLKTHPRFIFDLPRFGIESTQEVAVQVDVHQRYREITKRHADGDGHFDVQSEEIHIAE
ncbi:hypothetical protein D9M71_778360 [compost metagenome]